MDAVEFWKAKNKMTDNCKHCFGCLLFDICSMDVQVQVEQCVAIVEQWSKEHPIKTYKDVFLKLFPNALLDSNEYPMSCLWHIGMINICPNHAVIVKHLGCRDCWNREYKELS